MQKFYKHNVAHNLPVPIILGLSASPVMNSKPESLRNIESNLDSICRTPIIHKAELSSHVNVPELLQVQFLESVPADEMYSTTLALRSLRDNIKALNIETDPYIIHLRANMTDRNQRDLEKVLRTGKTSCRDQLRAFCATSFHIFHELGGWAANYYISECISRYVDRLYALQGPFEHLHHQEKIYIVGVLARVDLTQSKVSIKEPQALSDKVEQFIRAMPQDNALIGIVFVQQRATAAVLTKLLSLHPKTSGQLRVASVVGTSHYALRSKSIGELITPEDQADTLDKFRAGELHLVIATSILNEGIDVPACNFVLCFDPPDNLKTFVQRRGRARQQRSKLILMQPSNISDHETWQALEIQMKETYADRKRELRELEEVENLEVVDDRQFRVESTGSVHLRYT